MSRPGPPGVPARMADEVRHLLALVEQGQLPAALAEGSALAVRYPDDPSVQNILGVVQARMGHTEAAVACYERALALKPDFVGALNNLGNALARLGRHAGAIAAYRRALQLKPDFAEACNGLGSALHATGQVSAAEASYRRALELRPGYLEARNNLGNALADLGRPDDALVCFDAVLASSPDLLQAWCNRGKTLVALGRHDDAVASFRGAIERAPDYAEAYNALGNTLNQMGLHRQAAEYLARAVQLDPGCADARNNLANALADLGQTGAAVAEYRAALGVDPGRAEIHCNLGNALHDLGRDEEAIACYLEALRLKPDFAEAFNNLSQVKTFHSGDPQIAQMEDRLADPTIDPNDAMHLGFALGKAWDDLGDADRAFSHWLRANRLKKQALGYRIDDDRARFARIKSLFSGPDWSGLQGVGPAGEPGRRPVFIVGLPRSGTTLVEQILASHSQVFGAGELGILGRTLEPLLRQMETGDRRGLDAEALVNLRETYLRELELLPGAEPLVTDKMPGNFRWIGFILAAMPGTKIVHVHRDPVATCWSLFRHHFGAAGNAYAFDLGDIAGYYKLYLDLMQFWQRALPGQIHDLGYEALTENQAGETRRLLEYCGLGWEEQCLAFHETQRSVRTLSGRQVRQPMYAGSSEAWRKYEAHLQPLLAALGDRAR